MSKQPIRIVALGSSFAAGPGIKPLVDKTASRSACNYAHIVAKHLNAELIDRSSSGATLEHVLNAEQKFLFTSLPPQLQTLDATTDIVFLTAGGNDIGYSLGMIRDSALASTGYLGSLINRIFVGSPQPTTILHGRLHAVMKRIHELSPLCQIYLVEYLTVFGKDSASSIDTPLDAEQIRQYQDQAETLASVYNDVAANYDNVQVVRMSSLSQYHGVGSEVPWVSGFSWRMLSDGTAPYHPNREGHEAIAAEILKTLQSVKSPQ